ncbi:MAG TPA: branched-chain amino acid ABC transporter permease [Thermodesulfobacteriota bacterium]|nr:branched-chain amino acid ABC transporter permease [Thermodesulfobacteriota bacterium]
MKNSLRKWLFFGFMATLFLLLPFLTPYYSLATEMLIFAIFAVGYDIIFGYTGLLSFGHAIFFGIGAYGTGLVLVRLVPSLFLALVIAVGISLLVSSIIAFLSIRIRGIYFVMITLAFCQMFYFIAFKWKGLTGGDNGFHGVPRTSFGPIDLNSEITFYFFILAIFCLSVLLAFRIVRSPFGRVLRALKENEDRARSVGYNTTRFKTIAFMISAFFASLAGGLYAVHSNFVPLDTLSINMSGDVVIMALLGGIGTLYGPILGAMLIVYLKNLLSNWIGNWNLILGAIFIVSVLTMRQGVFPVIFSKLKEKL